ncbi:hypothetical protein M5K25_003499 [Dendrobium thyrsiflorum]|uniref:Uncharacterized protein n=1 Tax=Dendrobium thyrsiflorum TaxID=117978 RepID=A0ABD0VJN1_DENTH
MLFCGNAIGIIQGVLPGYEKVEEKQKQTNQSSCKSSFVHLILSFFAVAEFGSAFTRQVREAIQLESEKTYQSARKVFDEMILKIGQASNNVSTYDLAMRFGYNL